MLPRLCLASLLLLFISSTAHAKLEMKRVAEAVLSELYHAHGNQQVPMPSIEIVPGKENGAMYIRRSNTIALDGFLYLICDSIGTDALAFVLGHELVHAFQDGLDAHYTSFLAQEHAHGDGKEVEAVADIHGLFIAYLAGYTRAGEYLPELIARIYRNYGLSPELPDYPPLPERQSTLAKARAQAEQLICLHEAGLYALAAGQHALAIACFEHVKAYYEGQEVLSNLGMAYALQALNFAPQPVTGYLFPFEASWETRMRNVRRDDLNEQELTQMQGYLRRADDYLSRAAQAAPGRLPVHTNLMCVMVLSGHASAALAYSDGLGLSALPATPTSRQQWQLALALAHAHLGQAEAALGIWQTLETTAGLAAAQAAFNHKVFQKGDAPPPAQAVCTEVPAEAEDIWDDVDLSNCDGSGHPLSLLSNAPARLWLAQTANSWSYCFDFQSRTFALQIIDHELPHSVPWVPQTSFFTEQGGLLHCPEEKLVLRLSAQGRVLGWARYYARK
jgi:tetratricopeptide (TPR) repeat protein